MQVQSSDSRKKTSLLLVCVSNCVILQICCVYTDFTGLQNIERREKRREKKRSPTSVTSLRCLPLIFCFPYKSTSHHQFASLDSLGQREEGMKVEGEQRENYRGGRSRKRGMRGLEPSKEGEVEWKRWEDNFQEQTGRAEPPAVTVM